MRWGAMRCDAIGSEHVDDVMRAVTRTGAYTGAVSLEEKKKRKDEKKDRRTFIPLLDLLVSHAGSRLRQEAYRRFTVVFARKDAKTQLPPPQ